MKGVFSGGKTRFYMPCGNGSLENAVCKIKEYCENQGIEPAFVSVSPKHFEMLKTFFNAEYIESRDYSDYVYSAEALSNLSGRAYHQKRNHISRFKKLYPNYNFSIIDKQNVDKVKKFYSAFIKSVPSENNSQIIERECANVAINFIDEIGLIGAFIEIDDKVIAFTVGDIKGDTLYVHVEKADRNFEGSYAVINNEFVKYCREKYDIQWVNREDDSGDLGLRQAKLSYKPDHFAIKGIMNLV